MDADVATAAAAVAAAEVVGVVAQRTRCCFPVLVAVELDAIGICCWGFVATTWHVLGTLRTLLDQLLVAPLVASAVVVVIYYLHRFVVVELLVSLVETVALDLTLIQLLHH